MTTPENVGCQTCGGDGIDGSDDAARFYAYSGKITPCPICGPENVECPTCDGKGVLGIEDYPERPITDCPDCTPENVEEPT